MPEKIPCRLLPNRISSLMQILLLAVTWQEQRRCTALAGEPNQALQRLDQISE